MTLNKNTFKITVTDLETEEVVAEHNANAIFCGYNSADEDNRTGVFTACNGTERAVASAITGAFQGIYAVATQNPKINDLLPSLSPSLSCTPIPIQKISCAAIAKPP